MMRPVGAHFNVIFGSKALSWALINEQRRTRITIRVNFFTAQVFMTNAITKADFFYSTLSAESIKTSIKKPVARNGPLFIFD
jgi:hypothetical protein